MLQDVLKVELLKKNIRNGTATILKKKVTDTMKDTHILCTVEGRHEVCNKYQCIIKYYSAEKRIQVLMHVTIQINHQNMLKEARCKRLYIV